MSQQNLSNTAIETRATILLMATHSILDIARIAERRGDGVAAPLSANELQRVFGTLEPKRDQVEERWEEIVEALDRWQACYFVVFQDGQVPAYVFVGCSGD